MSVYEEAARARKVDAIVSCLWAAMSHEDRKNHDTPWRISQAPDTWRAQVAEQAGVNPPSQESWDLVVIELCKLTNAERYFGTSVCKTCNGYRVCEPPWNDPAPCSGCSVNGGEPTGHELCENCREQVGTVVTPAGIYDRDCAAQLWPMLVRPTLVPSDPFDGINGEAPSAARQTRARIHR